jgi:large subunit ribosomal protein L18
MKIINRSAKLKRALRVRAKLVGTKERPRLSVTRSNQHLQAQLIDDTAGITLLGMSTRSLKTKGSKTEQAVALGDSLSKAAVEQGIKAVIFDRGSARYHGRVKAVADAARAGGLEF